MAGARVQQSNNASAASPVNLESRLKAKTVMWVLGIALVALAVGIAGLFAWGSHLSREVRRWDAKIDALCAANGGKDVATRVYETALAPETKEYFAETSPTKSLRIPSRLQGETLGPKYPYVLETYVMEVLNKNGPSVVKYTERIVRVGDNKVLAERFGYQRAGGGIPGFDPGEIRNCPVDTLSRRLEPNVFVNHPLRGEIVKP